MRNAMFAVLKVKG